MARELRRLLIGPERLAATGDCAEALGGSGGATLLLTASESHYLTRVLRYGPGDRFGLTDGAGRLWSAVLLDQRRARLEQPVATPLQSRSLPTPELELAVALPRRDFDILLRMACELGVDRLQPLLAECGTARGEWKPERWQAIVREACEQCERLWLPQLPEPAPALCWLAKPRRGLALLATTRRDALPLLGSVLPPVAGPQAAQQQAPPPVALAIGPEGGWAPAEEVGAQAAGWLPVSLGPCILRTSTAAVAGLAVLAQWRAGGLSSSEGCWRSP